MNASAQALSIGLVSKIANVSTIIQSEIAAAIVDFSPWLTSTEQQREFDPLSLDFGISFSSAQPHLSCSCILLQVYFSGELQKPTRHFRGIEATGHDYRGQYWRFSSLKDCQFSGMHIPTTQSQQQLKRVFSQIHTLFGCPVTLMQ